MIYILLYLGAIVLANLSITRFGPNAAIIVAFVLIGLDLTARDKLHDQWENDRLVIKMSALILSGSLLSWLLNSNSQRVAIASFVAFLAAAATDSVVYHSLRRFPKLLRVNGSNLLSAAIDSLVFPTLAFGQLLWPVILGQFLAKTVGGAAWSIIFKYAGNFLAARR